MNNRFYDDKQEYAVSTFLFEDWDLDTALWSISRHGFHSVELWADKLAHVDPRITPDEKQVAALLRQYGMHVHALHTPFRNFRHFEDAEEGKAYRENIWKKSLDFCGRFGIPIAVIHALNRADYNFGEADVPYLHDLLAELASYAKCRGVRLALENIPGSKTGGAELCCTLVEEAKRFGDIKDLAFCLDIGHVTVTSNDMAAEIKAAGDRLVTFHIHNNNGKSDQHLLPDHGVIDWPKWHDVVRANGFEGQFVLEVCGYDDPFSRMDQISALFGQE